jgi:hypothetical protein
MYRPDRVGKGAFDLLLEYLVAAPSNPRRIQEKRDAGAAPGAVPASAQTSNGMIESLVRDAHRRVLRYKRTAGGGRDEPDGGGGGAGATRAQGRDVGDNEDSEDARRWRLLSDHERRKEYKRARRVAEALQ